MCVVGELLAALTVPQRQRHHGLETQIAQWTRDRDAAGRPAGYRADGVQLWQNFAQSLYNLKEFLYLR